jgi:hypothetical protein
MVAPYLTAKLCYAKRQELGDIGFRREMLLQVVPEDTALPMIGVRD